MKARSAPPPTRPPSSDVERERIGRAPTLVPGELVAPVIPDRAPAIHRMGFSLADLARRWSTKA